MKRYVTCPFAAARLMRLPLPPPSPQLPQLPVRQPPSPPSPQLPPCTNMPKPFASLSALGYPEDCRADGLSQGAALIAMLFGSASGGSTEAGICALTMSEFALMAQAGGPFVIPAGLASTDPFAAMCPEACSAHGVFAPGCTPPSSPPSLTSPHPPPSLPSPPPQPPQSPRVRLPPSPQLPPCTIPSALVLTGPSQLGANGQRNDSWCFQVVLQGAAALGLFGKKLSDSAAQLCALPMSEFASIGAQASGEEFIQLKNMALTDPFAAVCPKTCGAYGVYAPGCSPPSSAPSQPPQPPPQPPKPPTSQPPRPPPSLLPQTSSQETSPPLALWALLPLCLLLIAAFVLLYIRRLSRNRTNAVLERDRAHADLQMSVHVNHKLQRAFREAQGQVDAQQVQTQADDCSSLPDSVPARRSASLTVAPASLPPGPPSSSADQSEVEQEAVRKEPLGCAVAGRKHWLASRSSAASSVAAPRAPSTPSAAPPPSAASTSASHLAQGPSLAYGVPPALPLIVAHSRPSPAPFRAASSAPPKRPAPPASAAAPPAKKVNSNPYVVFCREQRPLLPRSLRNPEREWTLGQMWKALSEAERARYSIGRTPVPATAPAHASAPASAPGHSSALVPSPAPRFECNWNLALARMPSAAEAIPTPNATPSEPRGPPTVPTPLAPLTPLTPVTPLASSVASISSAAPTRSACTGLELLSTVALDHK